MNNRKKSTIRKIEYKNKETLFLIIRGIEVGVFAGIISVVYRLLLTGAENWLHNVLNYIDDNPFMIFLWFAALAVMGYIVSLVVKIEPMASGSGIPQIAGEIKGHFYQKWWRVILAKIVGGTISLFSGLSLGREGPSIQLGGMAGKGIAKLTKADRTTELRMISCGAGAGLSAAFNAPLSGLLFVIEEIHHSFDKNILAMGIVATATADFISKLFFGQSTIFNYTTQNFPLKYYWLLAIFGIVLGINGIVYNKIMSFGQDVFDKLKKIPQAVKIIFVFLLTGVVSLYIPSITGGGHNMIDVLLNEHPSVLMMIGLLAAKFIFSVVCFSSSAPGGIFFPLLILGTYMGAICGDLAINYLGLDSGLWGEFVVIGMAGLFAAIVRAPVTGIVLVFEMTGNMNNILPLIFVTLTSYAVANLTGVKPIYDTLLNKMLAKGPNEQKFKSSYEKVIKSYIVPVGSSLDGKEIRDINWGKHSVIVTIERGEESITPRGDVIIKSGDTVVFLVSQRRFGKSIENLETLFSHTL